HGLPRFAACTMTFSCSCDVRGPLVSGLVEASEVRDFSSKPIEAVARVKRIKLRIDHLEVERGIVFPFLDFRRFRRIEESIFLGGAINLRSDFRNSGYQNALPADE